MQAASAAAAVTEAVIEREQEADLAEREFRRFWQDSANLRAFFGSEDSIDLFFTRTATVSDMSIYIYKRIRTAVA